MLKKILMASLFVLAGCCGSGDATPMPDQDKALHLVWDDIYEARAHTPTLYWVHQKDLNCYPVDGVFMGFYRGDEPYASGVHQHDHCVGGVTWSPCFESWIAAPDVLFKGASFDYHDGAFAHELYHSVLWLRNYKDGDGGHTEAGWQPGGIVDQANDFLSQNGL